MRFTTRLADSQEYFANLLIMEIVPHPSQSCHYNFFNLREFERTFR